MKQIKIGNRFVGIEYKPYFIGEIGINHNGSIETAKKLIDMAVHVGIDAVKFQKRDFNNTITKTQLETPYINDYSFGKTYGEHKKALEFTTAELVELSKYAEGKKIDFACSAFDINSFDIIEHEINPKFHKIPSPQIVNHDLLEHVARYQKPVLLSTGMANIDEVSEAVEIISSINKDIVLMQCTSLYPTSNSEVNLLVISEYVRRFDVIAGYSSHDNSVIFPAVAVALGARVFEKHITLNRMMKGPDHLSSFEERGLQLSYRYALIAQEALGSKDKKVLDREIENQIKHRQSIVASSKINKGDSLTERHISYKSPGNGMMPFEKNKIIGLKAKRDINEDEILKIEYFKEM
ncbi:MAG: N-acetylneuraminate synthase family protein [Saprospiraceae bacterium]|nr:N-acetylneuraminate synthase family protein [Saprospiraceae bacterium]